MAHCIKAIKIHRDKIRENVLQIFDAPCKTMDLVANTVVEKVFRTKSLDVILDIQSDHFKQLADATPNTKLACIWETES